METILVTGGIGSGKSEVCRLLEKEGYPVYYCDSRVKELYSEEPDLVRRIEDAMGVPFSEIGLIFSDDFKRKALENVLFPRLTEDVLEWRKKQKSSIAFIESATAAERPELKKLYDRILLVKAAPEICRERNPKAAMRQSIQHPEQVKADWTIENNGSREELETKVLKLIKNL